MRERPMIFSGPMVCAIQRGDKTQTRRTVKLPPAPEHLGAWEPTTIGGEGVRYADGTAAAERVALWHTRTGDVLTCPYGEPGTRLWVKETWAKSSDARSTIFREPYLYRVDFPDRWRGQSHYDGRWRSPRFMPRAANRITLVLTDVRVQRLQDISAADIRAEGIESPEHRAFCAMSCDSLRAAWIALWDGINGKRAPWAVNPWVWAFTFVRADEKASAA